MAGGRRVHWEIFFNRFKYELVQQNLILKNRTNKLVIILVAPIRGLLEIKLSLSLSLWQGKPILIRFSCFFFFPRDNNKINPEHFLQEKMSNSFPCISLSLSLSLWLQILPLLSLLVFLPPLPLTMLLINVAIQEDLQQGKNAPSNINSRNLFQRDEGNSARKESVSFPEPSQRFICVPTYLYGRYI